MKRITAVAASLLLGVSSAAFAQPPAGGVPEGAPLRATVLAGDTLYVSGQLDRDAQGNTGKTATESAKLALDNVKKAVEDAGFKMNDLVLVQVFATDLKSFADFNKVYRSYFTGPMPARAFIGAGSLLGGGHFEVLGIAVKGHK
jgi:2-iminobutanoate/2-iminopropanoate deaminase